MANRRKWNYGENQHQSNTVKNALRTLWKEDLSIGLPIRVPPNT
jgi:hypothetical protein